MAGKAVHNVAKNGFTNGSLYDKARPNFPIESLKALIPPSLNPTTANVLEIGSGTGKFTALLHNEAKIEHLVAIEPAEDMRATFSTLFPDVPCIDGAATALPAEANSQDAIYIAQAFHWFDNREALQEFHRVLKPQGTLGLIWNMEDDQTPWVAALRKVYEVYDGVAPQYRTGKWKQVFEQCTDLFGPLVHTRISRTIPVASTEQIWLRVLSKSYVTMSSPEVQAQIKQSVMKVLETADFERNAQGEILYPYVTDIYTTTPIH